MGALTLVAAVPMYKDRDALPAYLETATERNLGFYQSLGFRVTGEHQIKRGPKVWFMLRRQYAGDS